ncbi:MAG: thermonuclease family protein [Proteobacteria bacterium]|nr:thermonuclease family protein [Pseudomonadota bacterium]
MPRSAFLAALGVLALSLVVLGMIGRAPDEVINGNAHALDGDSLVMNNREMRLSGLDAPESRQICEADGKEYPCGRRATIALRRALERGAVTCLGSETDRYGRLLVVCRSQGRDIGAELVRAGMAVSYGAYANEEAEAKRDGRGLWAGRFERPEAYRRRQRETAPKTP